MVFLLFMVFKRGHVGPQLLNAFLRRVDRATDARLGRCRGSPQRREQVVQEQHGLAGGDADDIAVRVDPPAFAKTDEHDVFLLGVDEHIANVLQAGQEDDLFGQGLAGLQRLFNGFFQSAERDLAEREAAASRSAGTFCIEAGPLGAELVQGIDAGIFDQSIGLDRDAADRLLVAVADLGVKRRRRLEGDRRGKKQCGGGQERGNGGAWTDGWMAWQTPS